MSLIARRSPVFHVWRQRWLNCLLLFENFTHLVIACIIQISYSFCSRSAAKQRIMWISGWFQLVSSCNNYMNEPTYFHLKLKKFTNAPSLWWQYLKPLGSGFVPWEIGSKSRTSVADTGNLTTRIAQQATTRRSTRQCSGRKKICSSCRQQPLEIEKYGWSATEIPFLSLPHTVRQVMHLSRVLTTYHNEGTSRRLTAD
jgi:hypothetical protein